MIRLTSPSVCVDRFEASLKDGVLGSADGTGTTATASSISGVTPITMVTYHQARQICLNSAKRLCAASEWQALCAGPGGHSYPYGDAYVEGTCNSNTSASTASLTGSFIGCISQVGGVDLSGNVWEWTDTVYHAPSFDTRMIVGGGFLSTPENSTCTTELNAINAASGGEVPLTEVRETLGFRCCLTK
jgi:formylglycine-generating enzyme required for sulfatase activity